MWARVTTLQTDANREQEGTDFINTHVIPEVQRMPGFMSGYWMLDASTGKALNVTLWSSEEALRATEMPAAELRKSAEALGASVDSVEVFKVTSQA